MRAKATHASRIKICCLFCHGKSRTMKKIIDEGAMKELLPYFKTDSEAYPQVLCFPCYKIFCTFKKSKNEGQRERIINKLRLMPQFGIEVFNFSEHPDCCCIYCMVVKGRCQANRRTPKKTKNVSKVFLNFLFWFV